VDSVTPFAKGVEIMPDGSVVRSGTNYSGKFQEAHDASKASIQSRISNLESGGVKGTGKTGEGIPLEEVKPDVLKQIHADDNGAYGYLPNEGTAYNKPEYDFTNVEWTKEMQNVRKDYLEASKQLESDIEKMTSEGFSKEKIAEHVVEARNQQKKCSKGKYDC